MVRKGFTLTELLVVMAVTAIPAAMVVPALSGGREAARKVACQDNLRVIGRGVTLYKERALALDPRSRGYPGRESWSPWTAEYHMGALYPEFVKSPRTYDCPGDTGDKANAVDVGPGYSIENTDYAFDQGLGAMVGFNADGTTITSPADDNVNCIGQDNYRGHWKALSSEWPLLAGMAGELCRQYLEIPPVYPVHRDAWRPLKKDSNHTGGANLLFMDAHAEWLPLKMDVTYPDSPAFESAIGFIPNPYIKGDNCIYEAYPDLLGDTYIRYYNGIIWHKGIFQPHTDAMKPSKVGLPPGWYPCP